MADNITVFGIPNCDTVKKARAWLKDHDVEYEFHDYRKRGIDKATMTRWCKELGWETLLNKRGTTWRNLDDLDKQDLTQARAISLMLDKPSLIKRPVIVMATRLLVGFDETAYQDTFG